MLRVTSPIGHLSDSTIYVYFDCLSVCIKNFKTAEPIDNKFSVGPQGLRMI